jgi:hypothetical protein
MHPQTEEIEKFLKGFAHDLEVKSCVNCGYSHLKNFIDGQTQKCDDCLYRKKRPNHEVPL